mgnify:CR=1 FL=1
MPALRSFSWAAATEDFIEHIKGRVGKVSILALGRVFDDTYLYEPDGPNLGGSEEAVIKLSEVLAARGLTVDVFANLPEHNGAGHKTASGVRWRRANEFDSDHARDALIVWRNPSLASLIKAKVEYPVIAWLMDPSYSGTNDYSGVDAVVGLTEAHRSIIAKNDGYTGPMTIIHNGIDLSEIPPISQENDKGRHMDWLMWAASPDRGLLELLNAWPTVISAVPTAQLHIFYGLDALVEMGRSDPARARLADDLRRMMNQPGIHYHGSVARTELMGWHTRCGVFVYPVQNFDETFCITAVKAQASAMWPVVFGRGALKEVVLGGVVAPPAQDNTKGVSAEYAAWLDALVSVMRDPPSFDRRRALADAVKSKYSLDAMGAAFIKLFDNL